MDITKDISVIRELAKKVAVLAALPEQKTLIDLWKKHNSLKPERPMFMIDQVCWGEMNVENELTCVCEDGELRNIEWQLRETLYRYKHMRDDRPIRDYIQYPKAWALHDMGVAAISEDGGKKGAETHVFIDQLPNEEAMHEKLKMPTVTHDEAETQRRKEKLEEALGGIMRVKMTGYDGYFHYWDQISMWRGVEAVMYDMADGPEYLHTLVKFVTDMYMCMLDQVEALGLINTGMDIIHCTGAYNDVMQGYNDEPFDSLDTHTAKNSWTYSAPQLFSMVSPAMHDEYDVQYIIPWFKRFGLGYYGCCEPEDIKVDVLRKVPNIRKISMSPWVNEELGAEKLGKDYVYSRKPNPANVAWDIYPEDLVRAEFQKTLDAVKRHGCPLEYILKDITTVRNQPQRLWKWADTAREFCNIGF